LLSSHILAQVEVLADRISILRHGKIVETGTLDDMRHLSHTAVSVHTLQPIPQLAQLPGVHNVQEDDGLIQFHADAATWRTSCVSYPRMGFSRLPPTHQRLSKSCCVTMAMNSRRVHHDKHCSCISPGSKRCE